MQKRICPSCGAPLPDDGYGAIVTCGYCGMRVNILPAAPPPPGAKPPQRPRSPLEIERDELAARLRQNESEWSNRVRNAERWGAGDVLLPLAGAAVLPFLVFIVAAMAQMRNEDAALLVGCSFWLGMPLLALVINRLLARQRHARALVVAGHRDQALAPLRARLAQMEQQLAGPQAVPERQRRLDALSMRRREIAQQLDLVYARVEAERTSGITDLTFVPITGCGVGTAVAAIIAAIVTRFFTHTEKWVEGDAVFSVLALILVPIPAMIVIFIVRNSRRKSRVAKLEEERDRKAPALQKQLSEVETELQRLSRG